MFLFLVFFLPMMIIREGLARLSEVWANIDKKKFFRQLPYYLIAILLLMAILLWLKGYR
jgi:hypothetical protein